MAETELTVRVLSSLVEAKNALAKKGYALQREVLMEDEYLTCDRDILKSKENLPRLIASSVLIRTITNEDNESKSLLVYKDKTYDDNGNVIEEDKTQLVIASPEKLKKILTKFGFTPWASLKTILHVFTSGPSEICLQEVEGLGLFFEYEEEERHKKLPLDEKVAVMKEEVRAFNLDLDSDFFVKKLELKLGKDSQTEIE